MLSKINDYGQKAALVSTSAFVILTILYYNVAFDYLLILLLLFTSFLVGNLFGVKGNIIESFFMKTALGLGMVGVIIYFILLVGVGSKSIYVLLICVCITISLLYIKQSDGKEYIEHCIYTFKAIVVRHRWLVSLLLIIFACYTMFGSFPMSKYDTLTKHLPVTIYTTETGKWYTNVTEAIVYGDPMVLQYTYTTFFASFGAYKALILFNVVLLFLLYALISYFALRVYKPNSKLILAVMLLTTPFFFEFATVFYLEILPLYFLFSAFVGTADLDKDKIWDNMEFISLLAGFSIFVKLTHIFTLICMMLVLASCCIVKAVKEKKIGLVVIKAIRCVALVIAPSSVSLVNIFIKTGNPLFPSYNGIFKSPYFAEYNFADPFENKLSLSFQSLKDIILYTNKNIEMGRYGIGIFLVFLLLFPIALFILFWKKQGSLYLIWSVTGVISYIANTLTSYNLRYYSAVWVLLMIIAGITISALIDFFKNRYIMLVMYAAVSVVLLIPNVAYIRNISQFGYKIQKDESMVRCAYCDFFDDIPAGKRVLSVTNSNQFKGQYKGYFASTTWHNSTLDKVLSGEYSWEEYVSSFDYVLVDKLAGTIMVEPNIMEYIQPLLGDAIGENEGCTLYEVNPIKMPTCEVSFEEPVVSTIAEPVANLIDNKNGRYYIEETVINECDYNIPMRYQINWLDKTGETIDVYMDVFDAKPGENKYCSRAIEANADADCEVVYIVPAEMEKEIKVVSYSVLGTPDVIGLESRLFETRSFSDTLKHLFGKDELETAY